MKAPQPNTDRLEQVEKLLARIAKRQENTERLARTTLQAIGETGQLIAATGKLVADNANQLAEAIKMTTDNTERMNRIEQHLADAARNMAFMQAQMRGHTAQPVPPAHPAPDQE